MQAALDANHTSFRREPEAAMRKRKGIFVRISSAVTAGAIALALLSAPAQAASASLKVGMSGAAVKTLQSNLVKRGYIKAADGKYGNATEKAVKLFQKHAGLPQDGVAGAKTQEALYDLKGSGKTNQTLKSGSKSAEVKILQQRLQALGYLRGVKIDTKFGPATKAALVKFQKAAGLKADGVAGPMTLVKLYSSSAPKYMTKGEKVVAYAEQYLGVKYVYAAADPDVGFDCSGLVYYVYKHYFDITVPRSAQGMINAGVKVEGGLAKAKPGDILCFGDSLSSVGHVAIYIGSNKYIHAPQTGDVVKIEVLSQKRIDTCVAVRRVFTSDD